MGLAFLSVAGLGDGDVENERDLEAEGAGEASSPQHWETFAKAPTWSGCR